MLVACVALSAGLLHFGTGLHPIPWLTWVAPLPVLLIAPRTTGVRACLAAVAAWAVGGTTMWELQRDRMEAPLPVALLTVVVSALVAALAVLLFRALVRRGRLWSAAAVVPAVWVSAEYLVATLTPNGAIWSLAHTQAGVLPVVQLAALTGGWGISFLVTAVPAALAASAAPRRNARREARRQAGGRPWRVAATALTLLLVVAVGGAVRLALAAPYGAEGKVALLASRQQDDWAPIDTPRGRERLREVLERVRALPPGTDAVVLPEGGFVTTAADLPLISRPLAALARERRMDVVAGVIVTDANHNTAMFFPAGGGEPGVYRKQHMVPGVEPYEPGDRMFLRAGTGVAICKDLDFPDLARAYRREGARVMMLPAWDFDLDGWQHARTTVLRGVENGFWAVRSAANGNLTVSDPYGRVRAETATTGRVPTVLTATVGTGAVRTLYTWAGDWFAWLCLALAVLLPASAILRRRRPV
ncbi:nitrilase-related carbon-nitrogen hydrolase [Microtetraspora fusca]|uniref:nitrilase-related carbon-nitrogen hydrolase n=1 Tax=Microtetraspora fusca TaxID=1997 RepID=UPI000A01BE14|nr:nitrilase-related carbon-nitrogen hydrolase [Microtetraspora fusca]